MKIGIWNPYLAPDNAGGGEKYMMDLAVYLAKENDVSIFVRGSEDLRLVKKRFNYDLSSVKTVPTLFGPQVSMVDRLRESAAYDLIIVLSDGSVPFVLSKKLMLHFQEPILRGPLRLLEKIKMQRVNTVFCNSQFTQQYIDRTFGVVSQLLYPMVQSFAKETKKENIILHVGSFRPTENGGDFKRQQFMIEAFKKLVERLKDSGQARMTGNSDWKFVLGVSLREEHREAFEKMKGTIGSLPIEIIESPDQKTLWELFDRAKIYWHASGFGEDIEKFPNLVEHFGITTVEAMSAGCVPILFNAGGQKEIVADGENGLLWNTEEELLSQTEKVMTDAHLFDRLSGAAKKRAKDFDREQWEKKVKELFG